MLAKERQDQIFKMLQNNGAVTASKLVKQFDVSLETVRRDLLEMERQGRLTRVHGGAVTKSDMKPFFNLDKRNTEFFDEKKSLTRKAMDFIREGDVIAVDGGSTAIPFAEALKAQFEDLTVVTYSLDIFNRLCNHVGFHVILCAGDYDRKEKAFYGPYAMHMLESFHAQKAFVCPSGVSLEQGIFDYQTNLYAMQMKLLRSADEVFILADSSKFEKTGLYKLSEMEKAYTYITDGNISTELLELYQENDITIYRGA